MAEKPKAPPKRLNRTVGVAEALIGALDPAFRKRGFASRDIITHWAAMAPAPYDKVTLPDKLTWPRGERSADGATLYLRCAPSAALALSHEGNRVAAAVNRYFGYVLVKEVRISAEPFAAPMPKKPDAGRQADPTTRAKVSAAVDAVEDEGVREALRQLGHQLMSGAKGRR
ncbi:MAG TPA: DciA family protein [Devosiaceae bacterium]|jgi:hypothetical protein